MKNTNLINKLKTEPKFRKNVIAITASSLVLVICAVSIPVGLHVRNSKVQQATAENITVPVTDVTTSSVGPDEVSTTEPTTIAALVNETTTAPVMTTQKQNRKTGNSNNGNSSSTSNNKPVSGSSNSSSGGSGNKTNNQSKPTTTKAPSTTKKTPTTTEKKYHYTELFANYKKMVENKGMEWKTNLTTGNFYSDTWYAGGQYSSAFEREYLSKEQYDKAISEFSAELNRRYTNGYNHYCYYYVEENTGDGWLTIIECWG